MTLGWRLAPIRGITAAHFVGPNMTRRTRKLLMLVAAATLIALVPVTGAQIVGYHDARNRAQMRLDELVEVAARRVEDILLTTEAALADVAFAARHGCTEDLIREFRSKAVTLPSIIGMGYISADGILICTSFGMVDPPMNVAETEHFGRERWLVRFSAPTDQGYLPGRHFTAAHTLRSGGTVIAAVSPASLIDAVVAGALGTEGRLEILIDGLQVADLGVPPIGAPDLLRSSRDVGLYDSTVNALASETWALAPWRENALVTGSLSLLAGLGLGFGAWSVGRKRLSLAAELRDGLDNHEFEIWYQPVIDLQSGRCAGAEALIRWRHPEQDLIPPDLFITLAEETGIIIPMTQYLMREVGEKVGALLRGDPEMHIAINLAPAHVASFEIVDDARQTIARHGIRPQQILFELTERGLIDNPECRKVVQALSDLGSEVAIDDFGTGYSSLAYIDKFKLDYLKIDKAFVSALGNGAPSARLTDVIIDMANSLGLKTIAEGVETERQARYLRDRDVRFAQGWHFSKPLTADAFIAYVRNAPTDPTLVALAAPRTAAPIDHAEP